VSVLGVFLGRPLLKHRITAFHHISTWVQKMVQRDFLGRQMIPLLEQVPAPPQTIIPSFKEANETVEGPGTAAAEKYLGKLPSEPFILYVGAITLTKGVGVLLKAYERLQRRPPLVLVGTVARDTPGTLPEGVVIVENVPHPVVLQIWDRSLFGVLPSLWPEPLSSVVYEGMSRGRAVIGTKPGGHVDIITDGVDSLLVESGNIEALAGAMQRLIDDNKLRQRLSTAAPVAATRFTDVVNVPRFEELYRSLIDDRRTTKEPILDPQYSAGVDLLNRSRSTIVPNASQATALPASRRP
jgi:glycosyltransferase involved in cell wall biosynthesis